MQLLSSVRKVFSKRSLYICIVIFLLFIIGLSIFYLSNGYDSLKDWFLSLNNCIYRQESWTTDFFTRKAKTEGNYFSLVAIIISISWLIIIIFNRRKYFYTHLTTIDKEPKKYVPWAWYVFIIITGFLFWLRADMAAPPAYDEVFSAVNCSELHPFSILGYYMLPNNHVYFNFINSFFRHLTGDPVLSGRILSLFAYLGVMCYSFSWLSTLMSRRIYAFLAVLALSLNFTVWGFGAQARGYELQLLCGWVAFLTMLKYLHTNDTNILRTNTIVSAIAFAFIPTFAFYYAAQTLFVLIIQASRKRLDIKYMKYAFMTGILVFLFYLPTLLFSGWKALADNQYVHIMGDKSILGYWHTYIMLQEALINICFSFFFGENNPINFVLFFLPILLLFSGQKKTRLHGFFYVVFWASTAVLILLMRRNPFSRNLIFHYSITTVMVFYTVYVYSEMLAKRLRIPIIKPAVYGVLTLLFCIHLYRGDKDNVGLNLYFYNARETYDSHIAELHVIPKNSSIAFSNESFYMYYMYHQAGYNTHKCANGNEDYYIKRKYEPLPPLMGKRTVIYRTKLEDYEIYKKE